MTQLQKVNKLIDSYLKMTGQVHLSESVVRKLLLQGTDRFWYVERSKTGNKLVYFRTKNK